MKQLFSQASCFPVTSFSVTKLSYIYTLTLSPATLLSSRILKKREQQTHYNLFKLPQGLHRLYQINGALLRFYQDNNIDAHKAYWSITGLKQLKINGIMLLEVCTTASHGMLQWAAALRKQEYLQ